METRIFGDKKITIRKLSKGDLKKAKEFLDYINSLIAENTKILMNKKTTLKEEKEYLISTINSIKNKTSVHLVAECNNKIAGITSIKSDRWRRNHVGIFSIAINKDFRGIGLGRYLMSEIIKLARKELDPKPRIIRLEVYANNKPAIGLYKKMGFKIVGRIPKQVQYNGKLVDEFAMLLYL
jgi:ribosomal protein S18 acetylase RimI-like enzyme